MRTGRAPGPAFVAVLLVLVALTGCVAVSPDAGGDAAESPGAAPAGETLSATVTDVVDGDTIDVRYPDGTTDTVRLLGIDTPETFGETSPAEFEGVPDTAAGRECLGAVGEEASARVTDRIEGERVTLRVDPTADRRGSYGRLLAYVLLDATANESTVDPATGAANGTATNLNEQLVADGYARVYDSTFQQSDQFYAAESDAQDAGVGTWVCRDPGAADGDSDDGTSDSEGGTSDGDEGTASGLVVATIHEDAAGDEDQNLDDEYVTFENAGSESLGLSGWTVVDEAGHSYAFPDGTTLAPGARVTLHTGSGTDSTTDLYWGRDSAVWNNDGDEVTVYDGGRTVLVESYL